MNPPRCTRVAALGAVASLALLGCSSVPSTNEGWARNHASIGVRGLGEVSVAPDTLTANVAVAAAAVDVPAAMHDAASRRQRVVDALVKAGIDRRDVAAVGVALTPRDGPLGYAGAPSGYRAVESVRVTVRDLASAPRLLGLIQTVGGADTRIDSLGYAVADGTALVAEAKERAYRDAVAQAEQWAAVTGKQLGPHLLDMAYQDRRDLVTLQPAPRGTLPAELSLRPGQHTVVVTVALEWQLV